MDTLPIKRTLTHAGVKELVGDLAARIVRRMHSEIVASGIIKIYPVPRGGVPVAYMLTGHGHKKVSFVVVNEPEEADVLVDDLIDSGSTLTQWLRRCPLKPFFALIDKRKPDGHGIPWGWVVFPWESGEQSTDDTIVGTITNRIRSAKASFRANENVAQFIHAPSELADLQKEVAVRSQALLNALLIDTKNDHNSNGTADRMAKMYCQELLAGRFQEPPTITTFPNTGHFDEMLISGPITIRSLCSHHMCPILGRAWIGMVPGERVAGLSKFNRVVNWFASRPQIQEELVVQIADYLEKTLTPKGLAVVIEASHSCMTWRGVKESPEAVMATNVMRGVFKEHATTRSEFFAMIKR